MATHPFILDIERLCQEWSEPRRIDGDGFRLRCTSSPSRRSAVPAKIAGVFVTDDLRALYARFSSARLFEDVDYGQWGLVLGTVEDAARWTVAYRNTRESECRPGDLIIGEFLGDSDLLLYRGTPGAADRGHIMVAEPIDKRRDWPTVANSLDSFFAAYARHRGDKFWGRQLS